MSMRRAGAENDRPETVDADNQDIPKFSTNVFRGGEG
jgi:hypothetical protein